MADNSTASKAVPTGGATPTPAPGTAGLNTQLPGQAATVSAAAAASGGIGAGNLVMPEIEKKLLAISRGDTPLYSLALSQAIRVGVNSPEVMHYMIDEPRHFVTTSGACGLTASQTAADGNHTAVLPLGAKDQKLPRPYLTLLAHDVDGYKADGTAKTPGKWLMLYVEGVDPTTGNPIVSAKNGPKAPNSVETVVPAIPAGTRLTIMSNAMYETQKKVEPDMVIPQPTTVYLQKRGMNQVVSDYFDSQAKQIPFAQGVIAEQMIRNFKVRTNRSMWASIASKSMVHTALGDQFVYTSEGIRWQFKRELSAPARWTYESLIALAKMFFTGEDVPASGMMLAGKNFVEGIQTIDYSSHPEIQISQTQNPVGWTVTRVHTIFGDFDIKHEPTLDYLGWSNSAALIDPSRLVHYVRSAEHRFNERVQDEEASVNGIIVWDGLCLKGTSHIWIDGEAKSATAGATRFQLHSGASVPAAPVNGTVYYLLDDCPGIDAGARAGQMWLYENSAWSEFCGDVRLL